MLSVILGRPASELKQCPQLHRPPPVARVGANAKSELKSALLNGEADTTQLWHAQTDSLESSPSRVRSYFFFFFLLTMKTISDSDMIHIVRSTTRTNSSTSPT
jgi:hypothetical protein